MAKRESKVRGAASEPVELHPGVSVREAARVLEVEKWAWSHVRALKVFYTHLMAYVTVNFVLIPVDLFTPGGPWFYWPLLGWGFCVGVHAAQTYEKLPWFTRDWEQRKVQELMDRQLRR
jgi:hypothetical protein